MQIRKIPVLSLLSLYMLKSIINASRNNSFNINKLQWVYIIHTNKCTSCTEDGSVFSAAAGMSVPSSEDNGYTLKGQSANASLINMMHTDNTLMFKY